MGGGSFGAASFSLEYVIVVVNIVLALEAVLAIVVSGLKVGFVFVVLAIVVAKGPTLDFETLPATNVAAGGASCILVA
jgi:hypothetical protein